MLTIISSLIASDLISIDENSIEEVSSSNAVDETSIVNIANMVSLAFGTGLLILEGRLTFAKLRKAFSRVLILYYFDPECYILIETNVLGNVIGRILNFLTLNSLG